MRALGLAPSLAERGIALYVWSSEPYDTSLPRAYAALLKDVEGRGERLACAVERWKIPHIALYVGSLHGMRASLREGKVIPHADAIAKLSRRLKRAGATVSLLTYLADDPDDFSSTDLAPLFARAAKKVAAHAGESAVIGIHLDQETRTPLADRELLKMARTMQAVLKKRGGGPTLRLGASLRPRFFRAPNADEQSFASQLLPHLDDATLMAYSRDPAIVKRMAERFLKLADSHSVVARVALEISTTRAAADETMANLLRHSAAEFTSTLTLLDEEFRRHRSYRGLMLHDYRALHEALMPGVPFTMPSASSDQALAPCAQADLSDG